MFLTKKAKNAYRKPLKPIVKNKKEVVLIQEPIITVIKENISTDVTETSTESIVIEETVVETKEKKSKKKNNKE